MEDFKKIIKLYRDQIPTSYIIQLMQIAKQARYDTLPVQRFIFSTFIYSRVVYQICFIHKLFDDIYVSINYFNRTKRIGYGFIQRKEE